MLGPWVPLTCTCFSIDGDEGGDEDGEWMLETGYKQSPSTK